MSKCLCAYPTFHAIMSNVDQKPLVFSPIAQQSGDHRSLGASVLGRGRWRRGVTDHFEVELSGSGPGPRRARTRNLAPRFVSKAYMSPKQMEEVILTTSISTCSLGFQDSDVRIYV